MCTRAGYSMALSYLGIDLTPGAMSALMERRELDMPYDEVTERLEGVERVEGSGYPALQTMLEHYLTDSSYSPVLIHLLRKNKTTHSLLIVGQAEDGRYIVVDSSYQRAYGRQYYTLLIKIAQNMQSIRNATFSTYKNAGIYHCYQWHLTETAGSDTNEENAAQ